jgi:hypothetical protein
MTYAELGSMLSGIGQIVAAVAIAVATGMTALGITKIRKQEAKQAEQAKQREFSAQEEARFREIWHRLWTDDDLTFIRRCLINEEDYKNLEPVVKKRMQTRKNVLAPNENQILDKLDRFCAFLVLAKSIGHRSFRPEKQLLWTKLMEGYNWINEIHNRKAISDYCNEHWSELFINHPVTEQDLSHYREKAKVVRGIYVKRKDVTERMSDIGDQRPDFHENQSLPLPSLLGRPTNNRATKATLVSVAKSSNA